MNLFFLPGVVYKPFNIIFIFTKHSFNVLFFFFFSDLTIELDGRTIRAHKFVLSARSNNWGVPDLADVDRLDLTGI